MSVTGAQIRQEIGRSLLDADNKPVMREIVNSSVAATAVTDAVNLAGSTRFTSQAYQGWAVRGNGGTAIGTKSYGTSLVASTGVLSLSPNLQTTPANADTFELWNMLDPDDADRAIDRALSEDCTRWRPIPVNFLVDGDFETSGVTNWTGSSATPTKTVETNADRWADTELTVTNSGANGYAGQTINVTAGDTWNVWVLVRASVGTAAIKFQDLTNSAAIATTNITNATWANGDLGVVYGTIVIPAGCRSMSVRLGATGASDVSCWQSFCFYPQNLATWALPARIPSPAWVGEVSYISGTAWPNITLTPLVTQPRVKDVGGGQCQILFQDTSLGLGVNYTSNPLFVGEFQNYNALGTIYNTTAARSARDTATTNCPLEYVKAAAIKQLMGYEAKPLVTRGHVFYYSRWDREFEQFHRQFGAKRIVRFVEDFPQMARA